MHYQTRILTTPELYFGHAQAPPAFQAVRVARRQHQVYSPTVIGSFQAPDAEQAIKQAIVERGISNPQEQARLAAQRVKEIG